MGSYAAVIFDWMLTLADYPNEREHLRRAHKLIDRDVTDDELDRAVQRLRTASGQPDVRAAAAREDCSRELHRIATMLHLEQAEVDNELAEAMYGLLGDPSFHPVYPEVADTLTAIAATGIHIAVISDIHVDLRDHARLAGIDHLVDHWILSYEHGVQKPDPEIFRIAIDALQTDTTATLMVGDRATHDGAAADLGIDCLILPARERRDDNRLRAALRLLLD